MKKLCMMFSQITVPIYTEMGFMHSLMVPFNNGSEINLMVPIQTDIYMTDRKWASVYLVIQKALIISMYAEIYHLPHDCMVVLIQKWPLLYP